MVNTVALILLLVIFVCAAGLVLLAIIGTAERVARDVGRGPCDHHWKPLKDGSVMCLRCGEVVK